MHIPRITNYTTALLDGAPTNVLAAIQVVTAAERDWDEFTGGKGVVSLTHAGGRVELLLDQTDLTRRQAVDALEEIGRNLVPVTVTVELALDAEAWLNNYGTVEVDEVRQDMAGLLRDEIEHFVRDWIDRTGNVGDAIVKGRN